MSGTYQVPLDQQFLTLASLLERPSPAAERRTFSTFAAELAGNCENPSAFTTVGRPDRPADGRWTRVCTSGAEPTTVPIWIDWDVRCRRCPACLRLRGYQWTGRAVAEMLHARRTWMVTLTFRPDRHFHYRALASQRLHAGGQDLYALDVDKQFVEVARDQMAAFTLAMKRLRKNTKSKIRYLLVVERHRSGNAHAHALVHELHGGEPVLKAAIQREWHEGFSLAKLVDERQVGAARYVAKYLMKEALTRVRASVRYGTGNSTLSRKDRSKAIGPQGEVNDTQTRSL